MIFKTVANDQSLYQNFMELVNIMLVFVRASRFMGTPSLDMFVKYFFAYDQQNYARLSLVYLFEMFALKENSVSSQFLKHGIFVQQHFVVLVQIMF